MTRGGGASPGPGAGRRGRCGLTPAPARSGPSLPARHGGPCARQLREPRRAGRAGARGAQPAGARPAPSSAPAPRSSGRRPPGVHAVPWKKTRCPAGVGSRKVPLQRMTHVHQIRECFLLLRLRVRCQRALCKVRCRTLSLFPKATRFATVRLSLLSIPKSLLRRPLQLFLLL